MAYLYRHVRLDKNEPFYIGIGSDDTYKRAYSNRQRNPHWYHVTKKTDYKVQIVLDDLSWTEAQEKEKEFISIYRRQINHGLLCNMTDGGEGAHGRVVSQQARIKISKSISGKNHGMYGKQHSKEAVRKIAESNFKKVLNPATGVVYESIQEAAAVLNLRANTLSRKLAGIRKNDTGLKYLKHGVI